ncbi:hypothetical protein LDENG_00179570 [Lucifuga dentata]|nr:hypothetical protein LDENG_00179570 [Lucifuga dentata]
MDPADTGAAPDPKAMQTAISNQGARLGQHEQILQNLLQGSRSVAEYSIDFRVLAAKSGWNEEALQGAYLQGLSKQIKDELAARNEKDSLDSLISLSIRLDNQLQERCRERAGRPVLSPASRLSISSTNGSNWIAPALPPASPDSPGSPQEELMQLDQSRLSPAERLRRMKAGECLYCGQHGHVLTTCPVRPKGGAHQ